MSLIGENQIFGDEDVILDLPYRATLKCTTNGSMLYLIPRLEFQRLFKTSNEAWKKICSISKERQAVSYSTQANFYNIKLNLIKK